MLCLVSLVRTDVSEECSASIIRVCQVLVVANVLSSPTLVSLMMEAICSSETSVLTRATWRNIQNDGINQFCVMFSALELSKLTTIPTLFQVNSSLVSLCNSYMPLYKFLLNYCSYSLFQAHLSCLSGATLPH
jgi:hypothetical protein